MYPSCFRHLLNHRSSHCAGISRQNPRGGNNLSNHWSGHRACGWRYPCSGGHLLNHWSGHCISGQQNPHDGELQSNRAHGWQDPCNGIIMTFHSKVDKPHGMWIHRFFLPQNICSEIAVKDEAAIGAYSFFGNFDNADVTWKSFMTVVKGEHPYWNPNPNPYPNPYPNHNSNPNPNLLT